MSDKLDVGQEYSGEYVSLLKYISATPELLSILYDWDLLPEQVEPKTDRCNMMIQFAVWYRDDFSKRIEEKDKRIAELEAELAEAKKDSERLDWLVEKKHILIPDDSDKGGWYCFLFGCMSYWGETYRAAIDKARGE